jgi:hypothetical protein
MKTFEEFSIFKKYGGMRIRNFLRFNKKYDTLPLDALDPYGEEDFNDYRRYQEEIEKERVNQLLIKI